MEALVTLAIGSLLLSLLFALTSQFVAQGFRLGNRALEQVSRAPDRDTIQTVLNSYILPGGGDGVDDVEVRFEGAADRVSGSALVPRQTRCAGAGRRQLGLELDAEPDTGWRLICRDGSATGVVLAQGPGSAPRFEFRTVGEGWSDEAALLGPAAERRDDGATIDQVDIRLITGSGRILATGIAPRPREVAPPLVSEDV